jgi:DNA-binding response OmpR family regulator
MLSRIQFCSNRSSSALPLVPATKRASSAGVDISLEPEDCNLAAGNRSPRLVLLSNDDRLCILVRSYLQHLGFCVFTCTSSDRAEQRLLERRDIDLWLVDVEALGMEAMYFAIKVRELDAEVPIVLISGADQNSSDIRQLILQNWIRVRKPIQLPDLLAVVHRALSKAPATPPIEREYGDLDAFEIEWMNQLRKSRGQSHLRN